MGEEIGEAMTTKDRIVEEALHLFSIKGYEGVSVKDIANAVGIKDSSLYKHFSSKKEIFETIIAVMSEKMNAMTDELKLPYIPKPQNDNKVTVMSEDELVEISKRAFLFYLKDGFASRFRRILNLEQYHDSEIAGIYRKIFMEDSIGYQSLLFQQLIRDGIFANHDSEVMAVHFYAPMFFLLNRYDNQLEKENEALVILEKHVRAFWHIYKK